MSASVLTTKRSVQSQARLGALTWFERLGIAVGIPEITLQADKYFFYRKAEAELGAVGGLNISITLIVLVGLYIIWLAKLNQARSSLSGRLIWGIPNLLMLVVTAFSVLVAKNRFLAICDLFLLAQAYLLFFYFANRLRTRRCVVFCVMVFAGTLVIQGFVCLALRAMGSSAYGREFLFGPISFIVQSDGRIGGTLSTPTQCGSLVALLWLPVLAVNLLSNPGFTRRFTELALITGGACLILTQTRSAIVSTAVGSLIFGVGLFLRNQLPSRAIKMALAGLIICLIPLLLIIQTRVIGDDGGSAESRVHLSWIAM
ncbi:MAG TPA: hypothetical protein VM260_05680, partial [Pirellula sp.]|nr:hypothetical protein [Pirellula sp.]